MRHTNTQLTVEMRYGKDTVIVCENGRHVSFRDSKRTNRDTNCHPFEKLLTKQSKASLAVCGREATITASLFTLGKDTLSTVRPRLHFVSVPKNLC